jgi:hypothetical protein
MPWYYYVLEFVNRLSFIELDPPTARLGGRRIWGGALVQMHSLGREYRAQAIVDPNNVLISELMQFRSLTCITPVMGEGSRAEDP